MYLPNFQEYLKKFIIDKSVLDCGVAGDKDVSMESSHWVHRIIHDNAKSTLGIDYDKTAVEKLKRNGYGCVYGDCQNFNLHRKFDVIFAGELIEHLENPGQFLDCAKKHLNNGGLLIITTPNQFSMVRHIASCFGLLNENREHVMVHNEKTITNLLERKGFKVKEVDYFTNPSFYEIGRLRLIRKILRPFLELRFRIGPNQAHQLFVVSEFSI